MLRSAGMMRGLPTAVIVAVLVASGLAGSRELASGSSGLKIGAEDLLLRLTDLPRGYLVGDDSGCGGGVEGAPERLAQIILTYRPESCAVQFEYRRRFNPLVENATWAFKAEEGARVAFADRAELFAHATGLQRHLEAVESGFGHEARLITTGEALVAGRGGRPGAAILWRQGAVLSLVLVAGPDPARAARMARTFARRQAQRISAPTPLRPRDNDDLAVALDDPLLGVPVYWLGRRFDPPGRLPALSLAESEGAADDELGVRLRIDYESRRSAGVTLLAWKPIVWKRFLRSRIGRRLWRSSPCGRVERIEVPGGYAVLHTGYARSGSRRPPPPAGDLVPVAGQAARECPKQPFNLFVAHVHLRRAVLAVNMPSCPGCAEGKTGRDYPYNSRRGIVAVARGLRLRR